MAWILLGIWEKNPEKLRSIASHNFEFIIEKSPWMALKDHILVTKDSITSKTLQVILGNFPHSEKPTYWRFVESFKCVAKVGGGFLSQVCT